MKEFRTTAGAAAAALCALGSAAWSADKPNPSGTPTGRVDAPNLGDPQTLGLAFRPRKRRGS